VKKVRRRLRRWCSTYGDRLLPALLADAGVDSVVCAVPWATMSRYAAQHVPWVTSVTVVNGWIGGGLKHYRDTRA
jgi:hypothetical protein